MEATGVKLPDAEKPVVYIAGMDSVCRKKAFELAVKLRGEGIYTEIDHMERSLKAQFKYADKIGAEYVAVIGGNELETGIMNVKRMADSTSEQVPFEEAVSYFKRR